MLKVLNCIICFYGSTLGSVTFKTLKLCQKVHWIIFLDFLCDFSLTLAWLKLNVKPGILPGLSRITISLLEIKLRLLTRNLTYPKTHTCSLHTIHTQNKEIGFSACSIPISYPPLKLPSFHFHTFFYGLLLMCLAMPNPQFEHFSNTILIILDISRQGRKLKVFEPVNCFLPNTFCDLFGMHSLLHWAFRCTLGGNIFSWAHFKPSQYAVATKS